MTKNRISQISPGPISRYGTRRRRTVSISASGDGGDLGHRAISAMTPDRRRRFSTMRLCAGDHILERLLDLLLRILGRISLRRAISGVLLVREDELALGELRILLLEDLLHSIDRLDVAVVRGDLGLVLRLVDVVHPLVGGGGIRRPDRDHHVVRPQIAALVRHHELDVGVVGLELDRVSGPADHRGRVSRISVSISALPLYCGSKRSVIEVTSGASSLLTTRAVIPLCHGSEKSRLGSKAGLSKDGFRLSNAGWTASLSKFCR